MAENFPAPSPVIASDWKAPGALLVASRQKSVAARNCGAASSVRLQEIVTLSVDFGTAGVCFTPEMIGGTLAVSTEFAAPGVAPAAAVLGVQFCPLSLLTAGLRSSMDLPPLAAVLVQSQPLYTVSRTRTPQSPSLAYVTSSTFTKLPGAAPGCESAIFSPLFESVPVHGPNTPLMPYKVCTAAGSPATTTKPPAGIEVAAGKTKFTPLVSAHPLRSTATAPVLCSSMNSRPVFSTVKTGALVPGRNMISLMTTCARAVSASRSSRAGRREKRSPFFITQFLGAERNRRDYPRSPAGDNDRISRKCHRNETRLAPPRPRPGGCTETQSVSS